MTTAILTRYWYLRSGTCDECSRRVDSYTIFEDVCGSGNGIVKCIDCVPRVQYDRYHVIFHSDGYTVCYNDIACLYSRTPNIIDFSSQLVKL